MFQSSITFWHLSVELRITETRLSTPALRYTYHLQCFSKLTYTDNRELKALEEKPPSPPHHSAYGPSDQLCGLDQG